MKLKGKIISFRVIDPNREDELAKLDPLVITVGRVQFRDGIEYPLKLGKKELGERIETYHYTARSLDARPDIVILLDDDYDPRLLIERIRGDARQENESYCHHQAIES